MSEQQTGPAADGEVIKARRKALGWRRSELARRAAIDGRLVQLIELGQWTEGEAIGRVKAVLIRAEGGEADVQLEPIQVPDNATVR
jgi:transcriptional regulator with XRE-family HTH domain